jgi:hypothetical protein
MKLFHTDFNLVQLGIHGQVKKLGWWGEVDKQSTIQTRCVKEEILLPHPSISLPMRAPYRLSAEHATRSVCGKVFVGSSG